MVIALLLQAHSRCSTPARYMLFWFSFLYCFFPFIYHKRASGRLLFWFSFFLFFYLYFFWWAAVWLFLSSIYSPNHRLVFYPLLIPVRGLFFFWYFGFLTLWCLFSFSFCIFVFSPCAMIVILNLLIATNLLKCHRFWAHSCRNL